MSGASICPAGSASPSRDGGWGLFPPFVVVAVATPEMYEAVLPAEEREYIVAAASGRRREFAAGRQSARAALRRLGLAEVVIRMAADRAPVWPPTAVGSITHCEGFCAAAVAHAEDCASLGLDAEPSTPLPSEIEHLVFSPQELRHFDGLQDPPVADWRKVGFCAKEAFYKCCYPLVGAFLDFLDVRVMLDPSPDGLQGRFRVTTINPDGPGGRIASTIVGRWRADADRVYAGASAAGVSPARLSDRGRGGIPPTVPPPLRSGHPSRG